MDNKKQSRRRDSKELHKKKMAKNTRTFVKITNQDIYDKLNSVENKVADIDSKLDTHMVKSDTEINAIKTAIKFVYGIISAMVIALISFFVKTKGG